MTFIPTSKDILALIANNISFTMAGRGIGNNVQVISREIANTGKSFVVVDQIDCTKALEFFNQGIQVIVALRPSSVSSAAMDVLTQMVQIITIDEDNVGNGRIVIDETENYRNQFLTNVFDKGQFAQFTYLLFSNDFTKAQEEFLISNIGISNAKVTGYQMWLKVLGGDISPSGGDERKVALYNTIVDLMDAEKDYVVDETLIGTEEYAILLRYAINSKRTVMAERAKQAATSMMRMLLS